MNKADSEKKLKDNPTSKCNFCGTINRNALIGMDDQWSFIDSNSSFFRCRNTNCRTAQNALESIKWQSFFCKNDITLTSQDLQKFVKSDDIYLLTIVEKIKRFKKEVDFVIERTKDKKIVLNQWKFLKETIQKTIDSFRNWRNNNLPFISLQKQFHKNNRLWKLSIVLSSISLIVGTISFIFAFLFKFIF